MYFSKRMQKNLIKKIVSGDYIIYELKLSAGVYVCDEEELRQVIDTMFIAWRKIVSSRSTGFIRRFDGIIRRLFFEWSEDEKGWNPYFHLICVQKRKVLSAEEEYKLRLDEEKLRLSTYIKWLSAWVTALKLCTDVAVGFSILDLKGLEKSLADFCTNEKYSVLVLVDELKEKLKSACGKHRLVSFHGIFRNLDADRHMSVER